MAYPTLRLDGQYTLKRVLTLPNNTSAPLTIANIGQLVSLDSTGAVVLAAQDATFFGILRTVASDGFVTVDFSGVHKLIASAAINPGDRLIPTGTAGKVVTVTTQTPTTALVALDAAAADGDEVSAFFLI